MKRPWMPLYIGDYLGDTGHLTTAQHGAYLLLTMYYWRTGGLPSDDKQLSRIVKMSGVVWRKCKPIMLDLFCEIDGNIWRHERIDSELKSMTELSAKRTAAATIAGNASALANYARAISNKTPRRGDKPLIQLNGTQPIVDHSHSYSKKATSTVSVEREKMLGKERDAKPSVTPSPELGSIIARKGWAQ